MRSSQTRSRLNTQQNAGNSDVSETVSPSGSDMMTDTSVSDDSDGDKWEFYYQD
jgi:hypothetical protein